MRRICLLCTAFMCMCVWLAGRALLRLGNILLMFLVAICGLKEDSYVAIRCQLIHGLCSCNVHFHILRDACACDRCREIS
jgi:hypothetical protein